MTTELRTIIDRLRKHASDTTPARDLPGIMVDLAALASKESAPGTPEEESCQ